MSTPKDLRTFMEQFEAVCLELALDGHHIALEKRLKEYGSLLSAWLEVAPQGHEDPGPRPFFRLYDRFRGPMEIDLWNIIRQARLSGSEPTTAMLADSILSLAATCFHSHQLEVADYYLSALNFLYSHCSDDIEMRKAVGGRIDEGIYSLNTVVEVSGKQDPAQSNESDGVIHRRAPLFRCVLRLINTAIKIGDDRHGRFFIQRLYKQQEYNLSRDYGSRTEIEQLYDYTAVVLAGWSLHVLQSGELTETGTAKYILEAALAQAAPAEVLISDWEAIRSADSFRSDIDEVLGVSNWSIKDWNREYRAGISEISSGEKDWIRLGLRASLLKRPSRAYRFSNEQLFDGPPKLHIWDPERERRALEELAKDNWLNIPDDDRTARVDDAMEIITKRANSADTQRLREILENPLSEDQIHRLTEEAYKSFSPLEDDWASVFTKLKVSPKSQSLCPAPTRWGHYLPRYYLQGKGNGAGMVGTDLGKHLSRAQAIEVIYLCESHASEHTACNSITDLPDFVRDMRRVLVNRGHKPNLLILPREDRFKRALFRIPLWEIDDQTGLGVAGVGTWEGLNVIEYPYTNPRSLLLADTTKAFGEIEASPGASRVWVEEEPDDEDSKNVRMQAITALKKKNAESISTERIRCLARMEARPSIGLANLEAALSSKINLKTCGFMLDMASKTYHRPRCNEMQNKSNRQYVLQAPTQGDWDACQTCNPNQWNDEGTSGNLEA